MVNRTIIFFSKLLLMIILKATIITGEIGYEYYWRDYDGVNIPNDALEVEEGSNRYIAQAYVHNYGIFMGTLHKGEPFLEVTAYGDRYPTEKIRILCTPNPPEVNMWLNTTKENYQTDVIDQNPVIGGWNGVVHAYTTIGRTSHEGSLVAGSISSYSDNIWLNYAYGGQEFKAAEYQVLVNPRVYPPSK